MVARLPMPRLTISGEGREMRRIGARSWRYRALHQHGKGRRWDPIMNTDGNGGDAIYLFSKIGMLN